MYEADTNQKTSTPYKRIQTQTAYVFSWSPVTRWSGIVAFTTFSMLPSPAQMPRGTKCPSFLYFSITVPPSTLLCSHLLLSRIFISSSLISSVLHEKPEWVNMIYLKESSTLLFCISKATYLSPSSSSRFSHWHFLPYYFFFFTKILAPTSTQSVIPISSI